MDGPARDDVGIISCLGFTCRLQLQLPVLGCVCRVEVPGSALELDLHVVPFSFRLKTLQHMRRRIHAGIPL